ncbi:MAG: biotin/lipoyl-binding protein [Clostridia bacterium]|nr:biotin/lipoyl-binding protein [Clostridia bacterium]
MMKKRILLSALLLSSLLLSGCGHKDENPAYIAPALLPSAGVASDIAVVEKKDHKMLKLYDGAVLTHVEELSFSVDGVIGEVLVSPGDLVKKGDRLITLDFEAEREHAENLRISIERKKTSADYDDRIHALNASILITEKEALIASGADKKTIDLKELEIEQAKADRRQASEIAQSEISALSHELALIENFLTNDTVYAPFDGRIARDVEIGAGSRVKAYDTVLYLADHTKLYISTEYISQTTVNSAKRTYARIGANVYEIEYIPTNQSDYLSKLLAGEEIFSGFSIKASEEEIQNIEAGLYAAVIFETNFVEDALLIPQNAVLSDADGKYVYVVGENGEHIKRSIRIKTYVDSLYSVVLEGLEEGESIYVTDK